ncbi:uncharacterized protein LOC124418729 [Lucilia cuprina]|uniref:uncharacterized protein LOC124418729 n=1 Tax=Lucilia cuprina TaxID=7375 RepID=UPI001F05F33C|nr:uncharacterized protein LOC124418729 [Lucilia cuprina]
MAEKRSSRFDFSEKKTTTGKPKCHICGLNHPLKYCRRFKEWSLGIKRLSIINKGYCLNCLAFDHSRQWCTSRERCQFENGPNKLCNARHHTILHREERDPLSSSFEDDNQSAWSGDTTVDNVLSEAMVAVKVENTPVTDKLTGNRSLLNPTVADKLNANRPLLEPTVADKLNANRPLLNPIVTDKLTENRPLLETPNAIDSTAVFTLPETTAKQVQPSKGAIKKVLTKRGTQTTPTSNPIKKPIPKLLESDSIDSYVTLSRQKPTWLIQPPLVRVNMNHRGSKMYTTFVINPKVENSYVLAEVARWLPEFKSTTDKQGNQCGLFVLEPAFPHKESDEIIVKLPIKPYLDVNISEPINDSAFMMHFKHYHPLGHPFFNTWREVDGVLGRDIAQKILSNEIEVPLENGPCAQKSKFGWIIYGPWKGCICHSPAGVC